MKENFKRHHDGSWEPIKSVTLKTNNGQITLNPGVRFRKGVKFFGVDIVQLLESS